MHEPLLVRQTPKDTLVCGDFSDFLPFRHASPFYVMVSCNNTHPASFFPWSIPIQQASLEYGPLNLNEFSNTDISIIYFISQTFTSAYDCLNLISPVGVVAVFPRTLYNLNFLERYLGMIGVKFWYPLLTQLTTHNSITTPMTLNSRPPHNVLHMLLLFM